MIHKDRIKCLNDDPVREEGCYVLYWMQQSQRAHGNPALEHAIQLGNELRRPVVVGFGLYAEYPDANARHFAFMLKGLAETAEALAERDIKLVVRRGSPEAVACDLAEIAAVVVCDTGYLRHQRRWRKHLAESAGRRVVQVEGDVVVPVEHASDKREWAARTIRKSINSQRWDYANLPVESKPKKSSLTLEVTGDVDVRDWKDALHGLDIDRTVKPVDRFEPGSSAARSRLTHFLRQELPGYAESRNDPSSPCASELSPYLHFGQISPIEIALKTKRAKGPSQEDKASFLEELIVRRELACNFVYYTKDYDRYSCLPDWARETLADHRDDKRPDRYTRGEMEEAATDDPYWNAAMQEMLKTGYMHNHMRMYWGKKIIEWCNTPEYAYSTTLYLNNKYFLDGRDANSYSNVAWLFGLHDQAWAEREVFGKVRYMNAAGLERKFNINEYVDRIAAM